MTYDAALRIHRQFQELEGSEAFLELFLTPLEEERDSLAVQALEGSNEAAREKARVSRLAIVDFLKGREQLRNQAAEKVRAGEDDDEDGDSFSA